MEREILFRGKEIDSKKWHFGLLSYFDDDNSYYINFKDGNDYVGTIVDSNTVGQFTGKCDKNGKKIFEGDIVWDFAEEEYLVILWCQKLGRYVRSETVDVNKGLWYSFNDIFEEEGCEVKGNIHDNPELLEGNSGN